MGAFSITYEKLFEVLRNEKNHEDLQKLEESFFDAVKTYVDEKSRLLSEKTRLDQFTEGHEQEQAALRIQIHNIKRIVRDIIERRERKVIEMAINKVKTGSNIIDTAALLPEEQLFFEDQTKTLSNFRSRVLGASTAPQRAHLEAQEAPEEQESPKELNIAPSDPDTEALKKVCILESVPKFVGVDLEIYGPYESNEEVTLAKDVADMLVRTNKAKVIEG